MFSKQGTDAPDDTGSVGGGDTYTRPLTVSAGVKKEVFPMVKLYPEGLLLQITNNSGVALNAAGNSIKVKPYNEASG